MLRFFPFQITFRKKLKDEFNDLSNNEIIDYFIMDFRESGAKNIQKMKDKAVVTIALGERMFKINNWSRWVGVNETTVQIHGSQKEKSRIVKYQFNMTKGLLISFSQALIISIIFQSWTISIIALAALVILYWLITLLKHSIIFYDYFSLMIYYKKQDTEPLDKV